MTDWVHTAERAYVAAAVRAAGRGAAAEAAQAAEAASASPSAASPSPSAASPSPSAASPSPSAASPSPSAASAGLASPSAASAEHQARAVAAAGAIASHYLAVGTPRSFGIVIDAPAGVAAAALALAAHRAWFQPRDVRCASTAPDAGGAAELAAATGGRVVSVDEALACDIANVYSETLRITPPQLRRGTHVNAVSAASFDPELLALATVTREADLPALAAGLVDGRQLDELTIFTIDGAPIAAAALAI